MSKTYDGIMGLAVGDALGVPVEFKKRDTYHVNEMIGFGTHRQPVGTWSDDTSMALATLESIGRRPAIDYSDIMMNFADWYFRGRFTARGSVFDVGGTTRRAIQRFRRGVKPLECGDLGEHNGNGSLMRILPVVFVPHSFKDVINVSKLTHAHDISIFACLIYVATVEELLTGIEKKQAVQNGLNKIEHALYIPVEYASLRFIESFSRDAIKSTGYVVDTLEAALWCFLITASYQDCVLTAVNLGDDTDTVAAVAGGLAGVYYGCGGEKGIPEKWIDKIARKEWIQELCDGVDSL